MFNYVDYDTRGFWKNQARRGGKNDRDMWRDLPDLPARPFDAHKGTFGTTLIVAGSKGMAGAAGLAGTAALRSGSGLTRIIVPEAIQDTVAGYEREYTTIGAPCDERGRLTFDALDLILEETRKATVVAVGPGLGRSEDLDRLVFRLFFELEKPAVFDADALNALAAKKIFYRGVDPFQDLDAADLPSTRAPKAPRVLTPHPGEFERLFGFKSRGGKAPSTSCADPDPHAAFFSKPEASPELSRMRDVMADIDELAGERAARIGSARTFRYPINASGARKGLESCVVALKGCGTRIAQTTCAEICDSIENLTTDAIVAAENGDSLSLMLEDAYESLTGKKPSEPKTKSVCASYENLTGNTNLATGGSGDVLTGIIAGLVAQGLDVLAGTRVGVALHGIAAELRTTVASRGAVASDIVAFLPYAFDYYETARNAAQDDDSDDD